MLLHVHTRMKLFLSMSQKTLAFFLVVCARVYIDRHMFFSAFWTISDWGGGFSVALSAFDPSSSCTMSGLFLQRPYGCVWSCGYKYGCKNKYKHQYKHQYKYKQTYEWPTFRCFSGSSSIDDPNTTKHYDVCVIGGGIVGLAVARQMQIQTIKNSAIKVAVLEKETQLATHQSTHNSGVVHAGIYYLPGSLRAQLCTRGRKLLYEYCKEKNIPHEKCGKMVVARNAEEGEKLNKIMERATQNQVPGLEMLDAQEITRRQPKIVGHSALWSPETGIVNFQEVARSYAQDIERAGGEIHTEFHVDKVEEKNTIDSYNDMKNAWIKITSSRGQKAVLAKHIVVCAGLHSDRLAELMHSPKDPAIVPFRGTWLVVKNGAQLVHTNIYPVPDPQFPFLGVHLTPTIDGDMLIGPNASLAFSREGYRFGDINSNDLFDALRHPGLQRMIAKHWRFGFHEWIGELLPRFFCLPRVREYMPSIKMSDVTGFKSGVRAQAISPEGHLVEDFMFVGDGNILHIRNAPSPAATSSLAIAEQVVKRACEQFGL